MELEFDKEIDAILRKARGGDAAAVSAASHLDADAIAAFVENAIPDKMRRLYTEHFADCDRCRKLLSNTILMNQTAASMAAVGAAEVVSVPKAAIPWYQRLFRTPNLAMAMGVLVVAFAGILGYIVLQNRNSESNASVAQSSNKAAMANVPTYSEAAPQANASAAANTAANSAAAPAAVLPAEPAPMTRTNGPSPATESKSNDTFGGFADAEKERAATGSGVAAEPPKVTAAAPPPAPADDKPAAVAGVLRDRTEESKDEDVALAKRKSGEDARRDLPAAPAKSGPTRGAGPVQSQSNQINSNVFEMPVTRSVGGKTFENRNGAWYDRAYRSQATTNVRRGTDEYKKLDKGIRSIADNLGGTVVVVWKEKAYRIQ